MNPRTVEDVLMDFKGRRAAIITALTKDVQEFYHMCDPSYPNLCLYGYPTGQWGVNLPPPALDLPEPRLGINFSRDTLAREDWFSMVALHSDAWLHAMASYFAAMLKFDKAERKRLLSKIAGFPAILEVMGGEVARKRARTENGGLPEEMLVQVLARVPVKDLVQYRSVSKMWRSLIDDSNLVCAHLNNFKTNSEGSQLLVMEIPRSYGKEGQVLVRRGDTFRKVAKLHCLDRLRDSSCLAYINGVMLVKKGNPDYYSNRYVEIVLWNPSMNRSLTLDLPKFVSKAMRNNASYLEVGLGFDAWKNDCKVIAIVYPQAEIRCPFFTKRCRATVPGFIQVYTLRTNSWSDPIGVEPPTYWSNGAQVFLNGAIHWKNLGPNFRDESSWSLTRDSHIVSFDIAHNKFNYLELPHVINALDYNLSSKESFLTSLDGLLAMFCRYESQNDIWVMKEYGVPESWNKLYTFKLNIDKVLYLKSNGEVLYAIDGKGVLAYDVKKNQGWGVAKTYSKTSKYVIYTYLQSLVLLDKQGIREPVSKSAIQRQNATML